MNYKRHARGVGIFISLVCALFLVHPTFGSVVNTEMANAVEKLRALHIIKGYSDGSIGENNPVTRGEIALMLSRLHDTIIQKEVVNCTGDMHPGLVLNIQDQDGNPMDGVQVSTAKWESNGWLGTPETSSSTQGEQAGKYSLLSEKAGSYVLTTQKEGYTVHRETISIMLNGCHVNTEYRTITLIKKATK